MADQQDSYTDLFPASVTTNQSGQPKHWAEIILPLALPKSYTYSVPENMVTKLKTGCRVEVVFGKNKKYAGIVKSISTIPPAYETKEVRNVIDDDAVIYPQQFQLWNWMSEYYMCTEGEVMNAALPAHLKLSSETTLIYNEEFGDDFSTLDDNEYLVAEALLIKNELRMEEVQQVLDIHHVYPVIKRLIEKKVCFILEAFEEKYKVKKESYVSLNPQFENEEKLNDLLNNWTRAPKQLELLLSYLHLLKTEGEVTQNALLKKSGATSAQLKSLTDKNILSLEKRSIDRIQSIPKKVSIDFTLSEAQNVALNRIRHSFISLNVCLLHGITSSGKTKLYIRLIQEYINEGRQVLYLLPEITLTAQVIKRLQTNFGGNIGIYHSKFNNNERVELWNKIKNGDIKIILGARSALFLPFKNLGLIIVDEEHDSSYKQQDPAPRYHARDAAIFYASLFNAKVLLGSATPSLESYFNVKRNKYALVELDERYGGVLLPVIEIIDTKQVAASKKGKVMLSPQLKAAIEAEVTKNKQVILFQNRRGYSPLLICGTCGFIPRCVNCDVTLTLHKFSNRLHCHYCGSSYPKIVECTACGSVNWMEKNFGTEKIEEELLTQFPGYRVARMDLDSVRGKTAHDNLIRLFEQHKLDILAGTQMVVKGLDFEQVSLVGILDADGLLGFSDFRVNERGFQQMEQVSGRAGRKTEQGKVMIQAGKTDHPVLLFVQQHDYKNFYLFEIENRKLFYYPPFSRIIKIILKHKLKDLVTEAADRLGDALKRDLHDFVMGPASPVVNRIRNLYLMELLIKLPKDAAMLQVYKKVINNHFNLLHADKRFRSVILIADVDPN